MNIRNNLFDKKKLSLNAAILIMFMLISIAISVQRYTLGPKIFNNSKSIRCTHYNNFMIFKKSFDHLIANRDLYAAYPNEYWDYYKYSPTFSILMAPFAVMPILLGLMLWNILNATILFFAVWKFPIKSDKTKLLIIFFIFVAMITSLQNAQSNSLIAGLILLGFVFMEDDKTMWATLCIALTFYIKIFGVVAFLMVLMYPKKVQSILYSALWIVLLGLLPLLVISPHQLLFLYKSWINLLLNDHSVSYGLSVMGWLKAWFGVEISKNFVVIIGAIILSLSLIRRNNFVEFQFRTLFLSSILVWAVIFNHKAESPTFIIAVLGIALWFFAQKMSYMNLILAALTFLLTVLPPTFIFPAYIRNKFVTPYAIIVFPCILVWMKITYDMMIFGVRKKMDLVL